MPHPEATLPSAPRGDRGDRCRSAAPADTTVSLPVVEAGPGIRPSRTSRWRALSLLLVHVLIAAHVLHWIWAGRTVTPVEPSEAMETLQTGRINAGFIFFGLALAATLVLGRFVCGWGCHLVAYQDLTLWILKKLHLRPRAFRSRLLIFVPLLAALYMFAWPPVYRLVAGLPQPRPSLHLTKTGFWDTFPGYGVAFLTVLVCGVAIVYFLGAKGFCTYACPYGAFFGLLDKLAIGRIRVTDACRQCGHCTAVCTSNVDVAREVNLYRMVVDPGCMKCMDCVSVCPNGALYFGLGRPALGLPRPPGFGSDAVAKPRRRYDLSLPRELLAVLVFAAAFLAWRGLYGLIPFLLSLGIAGVITYLVLKGTDLLRRGDVILQRVRLRVGGRVTPAGWLFVAVLFGVSALTGAAGWWRYHDFAASTLMDSLPQPGFGWQHDAQSPAGVAEADRPRIDAALRHLEACRRWGPDSASLEWRMAWLHLLAGRGEESLALLRRAAEANPVDTSLWRCLGNVETALGRYGPAREAYTAALAAEARARGRSLAGAWPGSAETWAEWGLFLVARGEKDDGLAALDAAVKYDPESPAAWLALGQTHARMGRADAARGALLRSAGLAPGNHLALQALEQLGKAPQDFAAALAEYDAAIAPGHVPAVYHYNRGFALAQLGRYAEAAEAYRTVLRINPEALRARADLGAVLLATQDIGGATREYEALADRLPEVGEVLLKLAFLYEQSGRAAEARRQYERALLHGSEAHRAEARAGLKRLAPR